MSLSYYVIMDIFDINHYQLSLILKCSLWWKTLNYQKPLLFPRILLVFCLCVSFYDYFFVSLFFWRLFLRGQFILNIASIYNIEKKQIDYFSPDIVLAEDPTDSRNPYSAQSSEKRTFYKILGTPKPREGRFTKVWEPQNPEKDVLQ